MRVSSNGEVVGEDDHSSADVPAGTSDVSPTAPNGGKRAAGEKETKEGGEESEGEDMERSAPPPPPPPPPPVPPPPATALKLPRVLSERAQMRMIMVGPCDVFPFVRCMFHQSFFGFPSFDLYLQSTVCQLWWTVLMLRFELSLCSPFSSILFTLTFGPDDFEAPSLRIIGLPSEL